MPWWLSVPCAIFIVAGTLRRLGCVRGCGSNACNSPSRASVSLRRGTRRWWKQERLYRRALNRLGIHDVVQVCQDFVESDDIAVLGVDIEEAGGMREVGSIAYGFLDHDRVEAVGACVHR